MLEKVSDLGYFMASNEGPFLHSESYPVYRKTMWINYAVFGRVAMVIVISYMQAWVACRGCGGKMFDLILGILDACVRVG